MTFSFVVDGDPKGQPRARAAKVGNFVRMYTPATAADFKDRIRAAAKEAGLRGKMLQGPLKVDITAFFPRPKGHYRTGKNAGLLRPDAPEWHTAKPDRDNCEKACLDALTSVGVWKDDSQVCAGEVRKKYANEYPQTHIQIECLS